MGIGVGRAMTDAFEFSGSLFSSLCGSLVLCSPVCAVLWCRVPMAAAFQ